jgi:hypothetical protein
MTLFRKRFRWDLMSMMFINNIKRNLHKRPFPLRFGRFFYCMLFFLCTFSARAQLMEDLRTCFTHKPSLYFTWDSRYTFISTQVAEVGSVKAGLDFAGTGKVGLGYNWYTGNLQRQIATGEGLFNYQLKMRYGTAFIEYCYFRNKKWEASIPVQFGIGWISFDRTATEQKENMHGRMIFFYEPMSTIQYRFLKFFAAGGGIGIRLAVTRNDAFFLNYNSPVFVIKTRFYFGDLCRAILGKEPREMLENYRTKKK